MRHKFVSVFGIAALLAVIIMTVFPLNVFAATGGVTEAQFQKDLADLRKATARYHDVENALADGFVPVSECTTNQDGTAAMGIHYMNLERVMDPSINLLEPELLLYAPSGNGVKLVGVEYFLAIGPTDFIPPDAPPAPELLGTHFDGPMFGHEPGMPSHYDFHVWIWEANPDGVFTQYNPNVKCD